MIPASHFSMRGYLRLVSGVVGPSPKPPSRTQSLKLPGSWLWETLLLGTQAANDAKDEDHLTQFVRSSAEILYK